MIKVYGPKPRKFALRVLEQLKIFARDGVEIIPGQRKFFVIEAADIYHHYSISLSPFSWPQAMYLFILGLGREEICVWYHLLDKSEGEFLWVHQEKVLHGDLGTYENPRIAYDGASYASAFSSSRSLKRNLHLMFWYLTIKRSNSIEVGASVNHQK